MRKNYKTILFVLAAVFATADAGADVVISQVYGGGNNTGATYQNDFIELFNDGAARGVAEWLVGAIYVVSRRHLDQRDQPARRHACSPVIIS